MGEAKDFGLIEKNLKILIRNYVCYSLVVGCNLDSATWNLEIHAILGEQRGSIKLLSNFINFGDEPLIL